MALHRMQAAGIDAFGGEVRMLELAAPPPPAPDEVVIAVHAAGVGNWDEIVRVGNWDVGRRPPLALGVEAAGVVAAIGDQVTSVSRGDEVLTHPLPLRHQARGRSGYSLRPHSSPGSRRPSGGRQQPRSQCPRSPPTRRSPRPHLSWPANGFSCTERAA